MDASLIEQQIKDIEEEIFNTQKNKATEHHIGKLKAKLARLREEVDKRKSAGGKGKGFSVKKTGDATVSLIGFPSIGKSTLLNQLTDAKSRIGDYEFTTLDVIPGMMKYNGAQIQLLDLPGLITGASKGKGRGREILSAVRNVDLILFMIDAQHERQLQLMAQELQMAGLRLNQHKPDVIVKKTGQGGITVASTISLNHLDEDLIKSIASEYVINADIIVREDITEDQLIDVFVENRVYVPAIVIINKEDVVSKEILKKKIHTIDQQGWKVISISAKTGAGIPELREAIFTELKFIRVYMKPVGKQTDYNEPLILKEGNTIEDACRKLHREFKRKFRYAAVTGPSAKHTIQKVGLDHHLQDGDVLTIVVWK
ncbi:MAG: GTP-binding protein [Candidatus Thermoplasmatota archaeon]|nr:GTP-binding protein [Candidatus Thermoplasmatota archaeon]